MSARTLAIAIALLGVGTLGILIAFSLLPDVRAAYPDGDFAASLSGFQRSSSMTELNALFGDPADPAKLAAMTAGNTLDLYGFIPVYGLFLICAAALLAGGFNKPLAWLAILPALVGMGADIVETHAQLQMTTDWSRATELLPAVAPACWTKYFALAAHALGCTAICFMSAQKRWILGAVGFIPTAGVFADWAGAVHFPALMSAVFGVFWIALLGIALAEAARKRT